MKTPGVMMALGSYRFALATAAYDTLTRAVEQRWPGQPRLGRPPALHYLGPGRQTVELSGTLYPHFRGGLGQLDALRAEAARGEPLLLVDGRGKVWGFFVVVTVRETQSVFLADGTPRKTAFALTLEAYGPDAPDAGETAVVKTKAGKV